MAVTAYFDQIDKFSIRAALRQPLHIGSAGNDNGEILVHPVSGKPFVQASGLAGVFRACYEEFYQDQAHAMELFGDADKTAGRIRFTDGQIISKSGETRVELRPRIRINPVTGTSAAVKGKGADELTGQKFEMEYLGAGNEIEFRIYLYSCQGAEESGRDVQRVEHVLAQIHSGQLQIGGQKSNGCGSMEILSLKHHTFNMCTAEGRKDWAKEDTLSEEAYTERVERLNEILAAEDRSARAYSLTLEAETEGSILVKSIALSDLDIEKARQKEEKEPDYVNMRNALEQFILPGSSLKGALRAQYERIGKYLEKNTKGYDRVRAIEDAFGRTGKSKDTGTAGNVRVFDAVVGPISGHETEQISNRIRIDRFTGGVMNTGLFKEQAVHGKMKIEAAVMKGRGKEDAEKADRSCGMLILTIRDLALGMFNLGSGYSVGRGFLRADKLTIRRGNASTAVVKFVYEEDTGVCTGMEVSDPDGIIDRCMQALRKFPARTAGKESK